MTMKEVWFLSVVICHHLCTSEKIIIFIYYYYILLLLYFLLLKILLLHLGFCPELRNILNGKVSYVNPKVGEAAIEFRCANNSFRLIGNTRLECIDGRWNGKLPYCHSKLSKRP